MNLSKGGVEEMSESESNLYKLLDLKGPSLAVASGMGLLFFGGTIAKSQSDILIISGVTLVGLGAAIAALTYLRGTKQNTNVVEDRIVNITNNTTTDEDINRLLNMLKEHIDSLQSVSHIDFTEEERISIIEHIKSNICEELSNELFKSAKSTAANNITENKYFPELKRELQKTKARLTSEIDALARRGNLNLVIGGMTTLLAVALLGYVVLTAKSNSLEMSDFIWHYIPRITVSIFIQVFSFFFLRLYKNSLEDIKYFQNELTNIDSRYAALESALLFGDKTIISKVIQEMLNTDRNSRLKKGESTVDLEKLKEENKSLTDLLGSAKGIIESIKDKSK